MFNIKPYQFMQWEQSTFCCGDYVRLVLKDYLGVEMPPVQFEGGPLNAAVKLKNFSHRNLFRKIETPQHLCVVEMQRFRSADHVGVYVKVGERFYVTHCEMGAGVLLSTLEEIQEHYKIVGFYEYCSKL